MHRACAQRKCRCARSKLIPAFTVGARTQVAAHQLVHDVASQLATGCLPVFSRDGLALYFYALTAHFGAWVQAAHERRRTWCVNTRLLYARSSNAIADTASLMSAAWFFLESPMTSVKRLQIKASLAASPGPLASAREPGRADRLY